MPQETVSRFAEIAERFGDLLTEASQQDPLEVFGRAGETVNGF